MYYLKIYDYFNHEVTALSKESPKFSDLEIIAIVLTKRLAKKKCYGIIEDENFERFGWYENGKNLDKK